MLSVNSKHVQHVKIYLACNFKVNLITHLEVIALFIPPANKVWGVYRNHPVRPSMYLVSATPPKPLIGFL